MGRSPTQLRAQRHAQPLSPLGNVLPSLVATVVAALVLFSLCLGVSSSGFERRPAVDGEAAMATVPIVAGVVAAGSGVKATAAVLGHTWTLVALELVALVAALATVFASPR